MLAVEFQVQTQPPASPSWATTFLRFRKSVKTHFYFLARCDLNPPWAVNTMNPWGPFGAIDSKITDNNLVHKMNTLAVSGPTWDDQPPFAWTEQWKYYPHFSQPKLFAFDFVTMEH